MLQLLRIFGLGGKAHAFFQSPIRSALHCSLVLGAALAIHPVHGQDPSTSQTHATAPTQTLSLKECLRLAMEQNHRRPASQFAVAIAEAQHRQALAAYWPQINGKGGVDRMERPLNFVFPSSEMGIPALTVTVPYVGTFQTSPTEFSIPAYKVRLLNPTTSTMSADFKYLLEDFGMRRGYREQTLGAIDASKAEAHRTDLEIADSVTRLYYGAVLAEQLRKLGDDTLERMEMTLRVTESLYQSGSGTVTKADYLDCKVMVETVRAMVAQLQGNEASTRAALAYTIGLAWNASVEPADTEIPFLAQNTNLEQMVDTAYEFNPDWAKVEAGLRAFEGERKTAASGHYPKIAITGELHRFWNDYNAGISTPQNNEGWTVGAGIEIPIFDGFLTSAQVAEAQAKISKLKEEKLLLKEGIGLQLRDLFIKLGASENTTKATLDAMTAAQEDRDLTTRGYGAGLLTTEKVIRAQIQEALVSAEYFKSVFDHRALRSQIDLTVGQSVKEQLTGSH